MTENEASERLAPVSPEPRRPRRHPPSTDGAGAQPDDESPPRRSPAAPAAPAAAPAPRRPPASAPRTSGKRNARRRFGSSPQGIPTRRGSPRPRRAVASTLTPPLPEPAPPPAATPRAWNQSHAPAISSSTSTVSTSRLPHQHRLGPVHAAGREPQHRQQQAGEPQESLVDAASRSSSGTREPDQRRRPPRRSRSSRASTRTRSAAGRDRKKPQADASIAERQAVADDLHRAAEARATARSPGPPLHPEPEARQDDEAHGHARARPRPPSTAPRRNARSAADTSARRACRPPKAPSRAARLRPRNAPRRPVVDVRDVEHPALGRIVPHVAPAHRPGRSGRSPT